MTLVAVLARLCDKDQGDVWTHYGCVLPDDLTAEQVLEIMDKSYQDKHDHLFDFLGGEWI